MTDYDGLPDGLRDRIRRDGAAAAFEALMEVAKDKKAPAPARATAGVALFRAAGVFDKTDFRLDKPVAELTHEETNELLRRAYAKLAEKDEPDLPAENEEDSPFD